MPRLKLNEMIDKHKTRYGIGVFFNDYSQAKKLAKGSKIKMRGGKQLPTPYQVMAALLREATNGDYMLESELNGSLQYILFATKKDANVAQRFFGAGPWKKYSGNPATHGCIADIDMKRHIYLAKKTTPL